MAGKKSNKNYKSGGTLNNPDEACLVEAFKSYNVSELSVEIESDSVYCKITDVSDTISRVGVESVNCAFHSGMLCILREGDVGFSDYCGEVINNRCPNPGEYVLVIPARTTWTLKLNELDSGECEWHLIGDYFSCLPIDINSVKLLVNLPSIVNASN